MDTTVANTPIDMGFPQDDAVDTGADYVDIGTLLEDPQVPTVASEPVATVQNTQDDAAQDHKGYIPQADFNRILGERLGDERKKYEATPEYMLGQQLIRERAARDGVSVDEAYRRITNDHVQQRAEQYAKNPKDFYADILMQQMTPKAPPTPQSINNTPNTAATLTQQLIEAGAMDMGFQPQHITPQFAADAQTYGVKAALALWQRGQAPTQDAVVATLEQRKNAPQPMRPTGNGNALPVRDYTNMSSSDFRKLEAALKQAALDGRRVRL